MKTTDSNNVQNERVTPPFRSPVTPDEGELSENELWLNMGPQHPSTHGVLRVVLKMEGEIIREARPDVGYLHRGVEKLAENRTYSQFNILTDRNDYLASMLNNWAYCLSVEKLLGVRAPERAEYLRVIVGELNRIASHLVFIGTFGIDIGAFTPFLYAFGREREMVLDLFERLCGARLTYNYIRIGGVMADLPDGWGDQARSFIPHMRRCLKEYDDLLTYNPIFLDRTKGIGAIPKDKAVSYGLSGPNLRASGVSTDLRKDEPYGIYDRFQFKPAVGTTGDTWDRYFVRRLEIEESLNIVEQALNSLPEGDILAKGQRPTVRPPVGESYAQIEGARGWLGIYLVSDGTERPYRLHVRGPSFINLTILQEMLKGWKIADVVAILGSLDVVLGEVDR
ncbi:MAG TPA: NADH-quinone oxidoreductase subunit D [Elusimicrobiota bacterium]|nr:NADH-quinone oxidoreductase subunit D [Elusimicrobiota bacterium]